MENQISNNSASSSARGNADDHEYDSYLTRVAKRFATMTKNGTEPLFTTDVDTVGLWEAYLTGFEPDQRQFHNCNCCKSFISHFGGLVVISEGVTGSAIWSEEDAPPLYRVAVGAISRIVRRAKVTGVFLSPLPEWGNAKTGIWRHFSLTPFLSQVFAHPIDTAGQAAAKKREDYNTVCRALAEFKPATIGQAVTLLKANSLHGGEKVLAQAQWLAELAGARAAAHVDRRDNVTWERIARAPDGFCHPRSSMLGTLLEDLESGLPFADVASKFAAKMNPTIYQRPQAAPSAGNIARAEAIVAQLGIERSLVRRFARIDELQALWRPAPTDENEAPAGVFGHLTPKEQAVAQPLELPSQTMTWEKFQRTVLPDARGIELRPPAVGNFCALVTAEHADAPPILQWDTLERRNPVSLYVYADGSAASRWNLGSQWTDVTAISARPSHWFGAEYSHHAPGTVFILDGAKDSGYETGGLALFPATLKGTLHEVRATIEAHSKSGKLGGYDVASACGLLLQSGQPGHPSIALRVTLTNGTRAAYKIDRWD
jgi:hypothetical protein